MLLVVLLLQSAQDLKLGRVERNRDAVVDGRGATFDVKPLEPAWSAKHEQMSRGIAFDDKGVGDASRQKDEGAGARFQNLVATLERDLAVYHPHRLMLSMVDVERRREAGSGHLLEKTKISSRLFCRGLNAHMCCQEFHVVPRPAANAYGWRAGVV